MTLKPCPRIQRQGNWKAASPLRAPGVFLSLLALGWATVGSAATVDLSIGIDAPWVIPLGQPFAYNLYVHNNGPGVASGVTVTNPFPAELGQPTATASQGVCIISDGTVRCELGQLPVGGMANVTVEATPTGPKSLQLIAGVTTQDFDWDRNNNSSYAFLELGTANLAVSARPETDRIMAGLPFQMTVTVTNLGPRDAEDVVLFSQGSFTHRCEIFPTHGCRYWPDLVAARYALSQGQVVEIRDGGIPWQVNFGRIPSLGFATLNFTLVPTRAGELGFSVQTRSELPDEVETNSYEGLSLLVEEGPGILEFPSSTRIVRENVQARIEIVRHDGAEGTVSVVFSTHDGTAQAGRDYVATTATVNFAPGETVKTVTVPILDNPVSDCNRDLRLTLSDASGGAYIFGVTNLGLTIADDDLIPSGSLELVARSMNDMEAGNGDTAFSSLSADGRWLAFASLADNLVADDTNGSADVFLKDLQTSEIRLVSVNHSGTGSASGFTWLPLISADGRHVPFVGYATDLVTNALPPSLSLPGQVFVRDVVAGTTELVSVTADGAGADWGTSLRGFYTLMGISSNGQMVAFLNDGTTLASGNPLDRAQLFARNRVTQQTVLVTTSAEGGPADKETREASLSADGRFIAFATAATNLVIGFGRRGYQHVYVRDLVEQRTIPVLEGQGPVISSDGRYVVILSTDANIFIHDMVNQVTRHVSTGVTGPSDAPSVSADGRYVAFRNGILAFTNASSQVYVHDCWSNATTLVSVNCEGTGPGNAASLNPTMSANGRYVFFQSAASDLVPGEFGQVPATREAGLNLFRRDLEHGNTVLLTQNRDLSGGGAFNSGLATPRPQFNIAPDGSVAVVSSLSDELVYGDDNGFLDLFIWRAGGSRDARPRLTIAYENSEVVVRWPSGTGDFMLQAATELSRGAWMNVPGLGTNRILRVQPTERAFYRLEKAPGN